MKKFKEGDRVVCVKDCESGCNSKIGRTGIATESGGIYIIGGSPLLNYCMFETCWQLVTRTIDDVREGDVITDNETYRYIHGVCGSAVVLSGHVDTAEKAISDLGADNFASKAQLKRKGWTIYIPPTIPEVQEVTMEQVCAKFGKEVKIKK